MNNLLSFSMTEQVPLNNDSITRFVLEANELRDKSDHATWANFLNSRKFVHQSLPPPDANSQEFWDYQRSLWSLVSGRGSYAPEISELNSNLSGVDRISRFYPFVSGSSEETGNYMVATAAILKKVGLNPGAKIAEYGVGWGHTTRLMASFGYDVTAVDIEQRFLDLLNPYILPGTPPIKTICASFEDAQFEAGSLDGIVFFECFHHCIAFSKLIANLSKFLRPGGRVVFCAEPFYEDWFDFSWGIRLDGHSVWAIRNFGWMELGFRKSFIGEKLTNQGFSIEWSEVPDAGPYRQFLTATRQ